MDSDSSPSQAAVLLVAGLHDQTVLESASVLPAASGNPSNSLRFFPQAVIFVLILHLNYELFEAETSLGMGKYCRCFELSTLALTRKGMDGLKAASDGKGLAFFKILMLKFPQICFQMNKQTLSGSEIMVETQELSEDQPV